MRQPPSVQLGEFGEDQAVAFFSGIGWGPLKTHKHDLGTDLFIQLRADDLTDLRMLLGAQVKTGPTSFREPGVVEGRSGWWFRESDKKHAEYWINHHVPHLLILQSTDMTRRVWTVLDPKTIEDTGDGIKVFVPADQVLDASWKPRWIELVTEARKLLSFEGARWTFSVTQVPETSWARYGLLTPRLVAPHRNKGYSSDINWAEAVGTSAAGDPDQWPYFAQQRPDVPSVEEAFVGNDPGWRFAAAVHKWVLGDAPALVSVDAHDFPRSLQVALAICTATAAIDRYDLLKAAETLTAAQDADEVSADQVWLGVHLAHVRRLQGNLAEAKSILEACLVTAAALTLDLTTSALRAACILGLFDLSPVLSGDVAAAVTAADNSASWWRTHSAAHGLEVDAEKRFKKWAGDTAIMIAGTESAHNDLFSAALTARLAGDFGSWRGYMGLLAQTDLVTPPDGDADVHTSLESLRQIGDTDALKLALQKVRADGPVSELSALANIATPDHATSLSIHADLELLAQAGDHFTEDQARPWLDLLLQTLSAPQEFYEHFALRYQAHHKVLAAIRGLRRHLTDAEQAAVIEFATVLPDEADQLLESPLTRLLHSFSPDVLDAELAAFDTEDEPITWQRKLFRDVLAPRSTRARKVVRAALLHGDLTALSGANDVTQIAADEASVLLDRCDTVLESYKLPTNGISIGEQDYYRLATVLALNGPAEARERAWATTIGALTAVVDVPERMFDALKIVAGHYGQVPMAYREELVAAARRLREAPPSKYVDGMSGLKSIAAPATELLLELDPQAEDWNDLLAALLVGDRDSKRAACDLMARRSGYEVTILALTMDGEKEVAARAARGLAQRVASDPTISQAFVNELARISAAGGESIPFAVLSGVSTGEDLNDGVSNILKALAHHASPAVREKTGQLILERGWGGA
ncbi:DUF4365 domain-containing protein [Sinomonas sp. ASV322]|uniref:DUF4365 domain-containing protein n=1 Tax=Sinomonas sp. ASV322 TaxID=3041920 RepID=UPI0027DBB829|nr:DUF4365 domain-containing protein [Sinomonas sp. ASV322]MDQ4500754.1 DUF4365 domain-containing protein [Sinomonas sp. ASV322]